jgi:nucleotide-binding universal stress UspA family protein
VEEIVIPLDGSEFPERALRSALATATRCGASVTLLTAGVERSDTRAIEYLEDRASMLGIPVATKISSDPPEQAIPTAADCGAGAVVFMATKGRSGLHRVAGGTVEKVLGASDCPVILVGPNCRTTLIEGERGRLLVSVSDAVESESVLGPARDLARALDLEMTIVEVVEPEERIHTVAERPDDPTERGRARLDDLAARLDAPGEGETAVEVLYGADVAASITRCATKRMASFIAMSAHARRGLDLVLRGSTLLDVVATAPCPVLAVECAEG